MRITFIPPHYIVKRQPNSLHRKIFAVLNIYRLVNQIVYSIIFPSKFPDLSKASTILESTCKEEFYEFLSKRFSIGEYNSKYDVLDIAIIQ